MLDGQTFKSIIENTPLVSLDICLVCNGQLLLGKRNNEPLLGCWFTPGGRILKNESWQMCLKRVARSELGLIVAEAEEFNLMGVWDHFYGNSAVGQNISTHYVNLPHYAEFQFKPKIILDDQHSEFQWFDLADVYSNESLHIYVRNYSSWLLKKINSINN